MTVLFTVPRAVRGPLTVSIPSTSVPVGLTQVMLKVNRFAWPSGSRVVELSLELSFDGGSTWPMKYDSALDGGQINYKGNTDSPSAIGFGLNSPADAQTRVRGVITLNTALDCSATVDGT
jgi:hypothetical protein